MSEESRATTTTSTYAAPTDLIPARLAKSETRAKARAKHFEVTDRVPTCRWLRSSPMHRLIEFPLSDGAKQRPFHSHISHTFTGRGQAEQVLLLLSISRVHLVTAPPSAALARTATMPLDEDMNTFHVSSNPKGTVGSIRGD